MLDGTPDLLGSKDEKFLELDTGQRDFGDHYRVGYELKALAM